MENWKDIKGYEGKYQVSDLGRVKSLKRWADNKGNGGYFIKEKILKSSPCKGGYLNVGLSKNNKSKSFRVHKLVAVAFLNHVPSKMNLVVDHIDNNKLNNTVSNLQVITSRENLSKDKKGTSKYTGVYWKTQDKKWISSIQLNRSKVHLGSFDSELRASTAYNLALMQIDKLTEYSLTK
jgi:hypothetical protein